MGLERLVFMKFPIGVILSLAYTIVSFFWPDAVLGAKVVDAINKARTRKSYLIHWRTNNFCFVVLFLVCNFLPESTAIWVFIPGFLLTVASALWCNWRNLGSIVPWEL